MVTEHITLAKEKTMDYSTFRTNLYNLMHARGITIKALGEEINASAPTISRYLSGDRTPDLPYVVKLAGYFNVSIDWLLGVNGDRFDVLPKEVQEVAHLYQLASVDDRRVIQAVLGKYKEIKK